MTLPGPSILEPLVDDIPGDDVPPREEVVLASVSVLQIVRVFPDIAAEERGLAVQEHAVLVGQREDFERLVLPGFTTKRPVPVKNPVCFLRLNLPHHLHR